MLMQNNGNRDTYQNHIHAVIQQAYDESYRIPEGFVDIAEKIRTLYGIIQHITNNTKANDTNIIGNYAEAVCNQINTLSNNKNIFFDKITHYITYNASKCVNAIKEGESFNKYKQNIEKAYSKMFEYEKNTDKILEDLSKYSTFSEYTTAVHDVISIGAGNAYPQRKGESLIVDYILEHPEYITGQEISDVINTIDFETSEFLHEVMKNQKIQDIIENNQQSIAQNIHDIFLTKYNDLLYTMDNEEIENTLWNEIKTTCDIFNIPDEINNISEFIHHNPSQMINAIVETQHLMANIAIGDLTEREMMIYSSPWQLIGMDGITELCEKDSAKIMAYQMGIDLNAELGLLDRWYPEVQREAVKQYEINQTNDIVNHAFDGEDGKGKWHIDTLIEVNPDLYYGDSLDDKHATASCIIAETLSESLKQDGFEIGKVELELDEQIVGNNIKERTSATIIPFPGNTNDEALAKPLEAEINAKLEEHKAHADHTKSDNFVQEL